jgi:glycosyltransferase involved in cell wall biosynthesis
LNAERPKVLVSAFACHPQPATPHFPGEAVLGWSLVREIAEFCDLHVMTWGFNRGGLTDRLRELGTGRIKFCFVDLPQALHKALRNRHYGVRFYYFLWQLQAKQVALRLHSAETFDLFHQITFSNDWMPSFAGPALPIPFVWGPVGGGQKVPNSLMKTLLPRDRRRERMRTYLQNVWRLTPARRKCAEKASAILVCNRETKEILAPWSSKILDFPVNGISPGNLAADISRQGIEGGFRILYAGRFDGIKGLPLALRALGIVKRSCPDVSLELIGEGPERGRLERLAADLGLADHVRFAPWLPRAEIFARMRQSRVFLFPSLRDGGGAVVIEAMASGIPVVCLDVGGPGFHIQPTWGIKVEPSDEDSVVKGFAAALVRLCRDEDLRTRLARAGLRRAEEYYRWDKLGERVKTIYRDVLDEARYPEGIEKAKNLSGLLGNHGAK